MTKTSLRVENYVRFTHARLHMHVYTLFTHAPHTYMHVYGCIVTN